MLATRPLQVIDPLHAFHCRSTLYIADRTDHARHACGAAHARPESARPTLCPFACDEDSRGESCSSCPAGRGSPRSWSSDFVFFAWGVSEGSWGPLRDLASL